MSENNSKSTYNDYCKFCGDKISVELSKKIKANKENVVCEICGGQLLLITNISKEQNRGTELITDIEKEHQEDIREELKELYGLNIYSADREKFGYYLTIFTSRSIYNIIKQYNLGINITDIQIEMISNSIMIEIINNRVNNEWLAEFKPIKKNFKKCYRELQSELSLNQVLQEVFLEFFRLLTKIIINLINKKDYSELQVIEYDIAEYLIKRDLFVSNIRLTVPFRYNLKICLSRLIYLRIKDIACKNNLNFRQLKLSNIEHRNISDEIIKYLTTHNEIINKFLGELESIKTDEFNEFYEYLCLELKSDNLFAESFNYYLRWLIGHIHNMVSGKYKWKELSHFDRIIGTKLAQLINVEVDFEKIKEFKENVQNAIEITQENPANPEVNELSAEMKNDNYELLKDRDIQEMLEKSELDELENLGESREDLMAFKHFPFPRIVQYLLSKEIVLNLLRESKPSSKKEIQDALILDLKEINQQWIDKMLTESKPSLTKEKKKGIKYFINITLSKHFKTLNFEEMLRDYLRDLIEITNRLIVAENNHEILNVTHFCEKLMKDGYTFGNQASSLHKSIRHLIIYLNENIQNFNLRRKESVRTDDDGKYRVCKECGVKKLYEKFSKLKKGGHHPVCKECRNKLKAIETSISKLKVITEIYGGRFRNAQCVECGSDMVDLPSLSMHHLDPRLKRNTLGALLRRNSTNYKKIIEILEPEKVVLMCVNCQRLEHKVRFKCFRNIILDPNLYSYTMKEIHTKITEFREKYGFKGGTTEIKFWIKKRIAIEYLFNGRCAGCGKMTVFNNLPSLEFHHTDPSIEKKLRWEKIQHLNIKEIIAMLLEEDCICLCANCHALLNSHQFVKYSVEILGESNGQKAKKKYNKLANQIHRYKIVKNTRLHPILNEFSIDKPWKKILLCADYITEKKGINEFTNKEIALFLNLSTVVHYTRELIDMKLISFIKNVKQKELTNLQTIEYLFFITEKGYNVITEILF